QSRSTPIVASFVTTPWKTWQRIPGTIHRTRVEVFRFPHLLYNLPMKLADLAVYLGATLNGDPNAEVTSAAGLEGAEPGQLAFVANSKYTALARTTRATAVVVEPGFEQITSATLRIANPYLAFARALELFYQPPSYLPGIHPTAVV